MISASKENKDLIIEMLTTCFDDNQSVNYIIPQDKKRVRRIRSLMDYSFEVCYMFGEVYLSDDYKACALIIYPDKKRFNLKSLWLDIKFIICGTGLLNIKKVLARESQIKNKHPKINLYYLWFIGVNPMYQHSRIGSKLIQEVIEDASQKNRPIFLETSTFKNLPWYERFGFHVYDKLELSYVLYFLNNIPA